MSRKQSVPIRTGIAGVYDTMNLIKQMGEQGSTFALMRFFLNVDPARWDGLLRRYWNYVGETEETLRSVEVQYEAFKATGKFEGDCDDLAVVVVALAKAAGYPYRIVAVRSPDSPEFSHVYVEIFRSRPIPYQKYGQWLAVDSTATDADYTDWERIVVNE